MTDEEIVSPDRIYACGLRSRAWVYLHSTLFLAIVEVWITRAETGRRADTSYLRAGGHGTKKCHPLAGGAPPQITRAGNEPEEEEELCVELPVVQS
jgi:hypothetical protein